MNSNEEFRSKFYEQYFSRQAARSGSQDMKAKITADHLKYVHEIMPHLPAERNAVITELGCGYGSLLLFLHDRGYQPKGLDVSDEQVDKARELGVDAQVADLKEWSTQDAQDQDVVIAVDLIEHFDKAELFQLLTQIFNRLKPGGKIILRTPNMDAIRPTEFAFGDYTHGALLNPSSATQLLLASGFNAVSILPSCVKVGGWKDLPRSILWSLLKIHTKIELFASGRSSRNAILTPNLIIVATRS
ncbi:MAG: class I SAM-dependent methyltransferase [Flavobacteriales bacterium]|nr:class I SAM-dependent methyltransferase [Flavobacteriales bacterium]